MAWSSKTTSTKSSVSSTEQYSNLITLNPGESAHVQVDANPPASPSDDMTVKIYATLDTSSPAYDDVPLYEFDIDKDTSDPVAASIIVSNVVGFRVGVAAAGASTTYTSVAIASKKNGISI